MHHTRHSPARSRAQLTLSDVSLSRGGTPVLAGVDVTLTPASRVAVVGENGRGKTTLIHLLSGRLTPDSGHVLRTGTIGVAEQEISTTENRTVGEVVAEAISEPNAALDNLDSATRSLATGECGAADQYAAALEYAEALDAWDAERRIRIALDALEVESDWSRPLAELSVGQRYRIRLACLIGGQDDFLLLDEPTNHLDRAGLDFLTTELREHNGGVLIVSHDRALLADVAETFVDLDASADGRPRIYGGGYDGYRDGRRSARMRWEQEYAAQQAEHARLHDDLSAAQDRLISHWRPDKGTHKHQRATRAGGLVRSVHRRQAALEAHRVTVPEPPQALEFPELPCHRGAALLGAEDLTLAGRLAHPVSLAITGGSRLIITGPNGAGKSTLIHLLAGNLRPSTGQVRRLEHTRVAVLGQESDLPPTERAIDLLHSCIHRMVVAGVMSDDAASGLSTFGLLGAAELGRRVGELSIGQQRRLALALTLAARPNLLMLDEPTNHLSITLVDELTEALRLTPAAVVLSTHDRRLQDDLSTWPHLEITPR